VAVLLLSPGIEAAGTMSVDGRGGGCEWAVAIDRRVAAQSPARGPLSLPFRSRPDGDGPWRRPRRAGEKVPLVTIAADAGVGIGTLCRRFPPGSCWSRLAAGPPGASAGLICWSASPRSASRWARSPPSVGSSSRWSHPAGLSGAAS